MAVYPIMLDADLQQRLERVAQREVRSPEFVLRDALEMYFDARGETGDEAAIVADRDDLWDGYDGPRVTREQFLKEVEESWEHYKRTGLHLTYEEVDAWLEKLQNGEDAQLPECHT